MRWPRNRRQKRHLVRIKWTMVEDPMGSRKELMLGEVVSSGLCPVGASVGGRSSR